MNALVLMVNKNFITPLNTVLYGLLKIKFSYDIVLFYDVYFKELEQLVAAYSDLKIKLKQIDCKLYSSLKWTINNRDWEINPFYRYEIFKLKEYEKIMYLDLDVVILKDFTDIFDIKGDFCAVELAKISNLAYVAFGQRGFNAGVMLISNKYLNDNVYNELIELSAKTLYNGNQKPLNHYFGDKICFLDCCYNLTTDLLSLERIDAARIIHFIGDKKPWNNSIENAFCDYVKRISGEHLLFKSYSLYKKELKESLELISRYTSNK